MVYLPALMVDFYGFHVGKYTVRPMDPSWVIQDPQTSIGSVKTDSRRGANSEEPSLGSLFRHPFNPRAKTTCRREQ